jgi:hypothetical protein
MSMNRSIFLVFLCVVAGGCDGEEAPQQDGLWLFGDMMQNNGDGGGGGVCTSSNCVGCCSGNSCMPGTDKQMCGVGGTVCQTCMVNQTCQMGFCTEPPCTAANCSSGCCDANDKCRSGTSDDACGAGGGTCESCSSDNVCLSGKCTAKGGAMYKVTLVSASVTGSCGIMELFTSCDPYVILKVGSAQATSSIKVDENNPSWNEYMLNGSEADLTQTFDVEVRDDDPIGSDEIGKCQGQISSSDLGNGQYVHECGENVHSLTWQIDPI